MGEIAKRFPQLAQGQQSAQNFFKAMSGTTGTIQGARAFTSIVRNIGGYQDILHKPLVIRMNLRSHSIQCLSRWSPVASIPELCEGSCCNHWRVCNSCIRKAGKATSRLVHWFNALSEAQKQTIGEWIAYALLVQHCLVFSCL